MVVMPLDAWCNSSAADSCGCSETNVGKPIAADGCEYFNYELGMRMQFELGLFLS